MSGAGHAFTEAHERHERAHEGAAWVPLASAGGIVIFLIGLARA